MHWFMLALAGFFEIGFTYCLKRSQGLRRPLWTLAFIGNAMVSLALLNLAANAIPVGTAYAVWTGIGGAGTAIVGIVLFRESATAIRIGLIALLAVAVVGLELVS